MQKGFAGEIALEVPPGLLRQEDEAAEFLATFNKRHERGQGGDSVALLREGIKANVLNMSPQDSQFIEQRGFSRQDIMMIFGLQHIPGDDSSVSYNSLEQKQLAYLASCLDKWLVRWEKQCDRKLRTTAEQSSENVWFEFNRETWLRTDISTKAEVASGLIGSMVINRNEARSWFGLNPVEDGDEFVNPHINVEDSEEEDEEEQEEEVEEKAKDMATKARLDYLTGVEVIRMIEGCRKKDFLGYMDDFYSKWPLTLLNNGIPAMVVRVLIQEHTNDLLAAAGRSTSEEQLEVEVRSTTERWSGRNAEYLDEPGSTHDVSG